MASDLRHQQDYAEIRASQMTLRERDSEESLTEETWADSNWRAPTIMFVSLLLGIASAFGHHLFYDYCNNREASESLQQQWVTRGGTAFAFVVKMFLATSTGTAYVQQAWSSVKSRPVSVRRLDAVFGVLGNAFRFADPGLWLRNPLLTIPAVITWLIPLASIVTPGTIILNATQHAEIRTAVVPQLDYDIGSFQFAVLNGTNTYIGPSNLVSHLGTSSAIQGQILQIPAPFPNASYTMTFPGPAISCSARDPTMLIQHYKQFVKANPSKPLLAYISWVPSKLYSNLSALPDYSSSSDGIWMDSTLDIFSADSARIYVFVPLSQIVDGSYLLLSCSLKDANYSLSFDFNYPLQNITVISLDIGEDIPATTNFFNFNDGIASSSAQKNVQKLLSYQAIMDTFGRILVGYTTTSGYPDYGLNKTTGSLLHMTAINSEFGPSANATLGPALERLFHNITLSMLSSVELQQNSSQASPILVTVEQSRNVYVYRLLDLYIAYGASIAASIVCAAIGVSALYRNGLCYSTNFSTILRTTRRHELDDLMTPADTKGGDPLPKRISNQIVIFEDLSHDFDESSMSGFVPKGQASADLFNPREKKGKKKNGKKILGMFNCRLLGMASKTSESFTSSSEWAEDAG